jgi:hypothetical protein
MQLASKVLEAQCLQQRGFGGSIHHLVFDLQQSIQAQPAHMQVRWVWVGVVSLVLVVVAAAVNSE